MHFPRSRWGPGARAVTVRMTMAPAVHHQAPVLMVQPPVVPRQPPLHLRARGAALKGEPVGRSKSTPQTQLGPGPQLRLRRFGSGFWMRGSPTSSRSECGGGAAPFCMTGGRNTRCGCRSRSTSPRHWCSRGSSSAASTLPADWDPTQQASGARSPKPTRRSRPVAGQGTLRPAVHQEAMRNYLLRPPQAWKITTKKAPATTHGCSRP
mmetsp:Transcript_1792/g.4173  ORF Transcript_1792/g.4173 Transcript_1792/m.4173 type:complete len:208 (+) Transcript_1792:484-1107(+)